MTESSVGEFIAKVVGTCLTYVIVLAFLLVLESINPLASTIAGLACFGIGAYVAANEFHDWWIDSHIGDVVLFLIGAVSASFGMAMALAMTLDVMIDILVVAVFVSVPLVVIESLFG